ncbi:acyltransferase family protein [Alteromonas aestuariivivens]|nr:acyltransferase family protein [Alteromonas aestuariivivens]
MLRFLLIIGLVLLHYGSYPGSDISPFRGLIESPFPLATFFNSYILFFFFSAVPLLSTISGWLFFKNFKPGSAFFVGRFISRSRSVLLPMILWNALVLGAMVVIFHLYPDSPALSYVRYSMNEMDWSSVINSLFGVTQHPINFQFWFLRDLLLTVAISPLLALFLRRNPWAGFTLLALGWLSGFDFLIFFRSDVVFFFYLGAMVRFGYMQFPEVSRRAAISLMLFYVWLVALRTLAPFVFDEANPTEDFLLDFATRIMRLFGVAAFWTISPYLVMGKPGQLLVKLGPLAFFLHAIHWPMNQAIKQFLDVILPSGGGYLIINYILTALITVMLAVLIARILHRTVPAVFNTLSGGRGGVFANRANSC